VKAGDAVLVAPGVSCGTCRACLSGEDHLCRWYGILGESRDGTCAELVAVPARNVIPKPDRLSFEEAASFALVFLTAWHMLVARARVKAGEWVLVRAAGSGVSSAAIQVAKLHGAMVIAEARGAEKCCARGPSSARTSPSTPRQKDAFEEVRRLTGKRGVDVVLDHVGEATWESSIRCLARGGRLVLCGATTGADARTNLRMLFFKNLSLLGSTMGSQGELREIVEHVAAGRLRPVVHSVSALSARGGRPQAAGRAGRLREDRPDRRVRRRRARPLASDDPMTTRYPGRRPDADTRRHAPVTPRRHPRPAGTWRPRWFASSEGIRTSPACA
jgi:NADPH:quinone reductase-like Zn-dependent oxidoreductase